MKHWYIPSWNGDLRLEADGEVTKLSIIKPTSAEVQVLGEMKKEFVDKNWIKPEDWKDPSRWRKREVTIAASIAEVGPIASKLMRPGEATLTAIVFKDGQVVTHNGAQAELEEVVKEATESGEAKAAATVPRPTPCCPQCFEDAVEPATEVLLTFLTPEQHASWAEDRTLLVEGGLTGTQYLLAHRNSNTAKKIGRICYDLDSENVVHFHNRALPPEEEVLSAMLILQHREDWLRNEATFFGSADAPIFKNPFGDMNDGVADAILCKAVAGFATGGGLRQ
jgi:hypothetical protein